MDGGLSFKPQVSSMIRALALYFTDEAWRRERVASSRAAVDRPLMPLWAKAGLKGELPCLARSSLAVSTRRLLDIEALLAWLVRGSVNLNVEPSDERATAKPAGASRAELKAIEPFSSHAGMVE